MEFKLNKIKIFSDKNLQIYFALSAIFLPCLILIRLTIRDSISFIAPLYYATPYILIFFYAFFIAIFALFKRIKVFTSIFLLISIISLIFFYNTEFVTNKKIKREDSEYRIMFFNLARNGREKIDDIIKIIRDEKIDIAGFVETTNLLYTHSNRIALDPKKWNDKLPEYNIKMLKNEMMLITKSKIVSSLNGGCKRLNYNKINLVLDNKEVTLFIVDIASKPFKSRKIPFETLKNEIYKEKNVIFMGDFNTPISSYFFDDMKIKYQNAFLKTGNGYKPTWPLPIPILTLDNIWFDNNWNLINCKYYKTDFSDHYAIISTVSK